jgi:hypothetical protein
MEKSEFTSLIEQGFNHIPFSREVVVDTDTALAMYLKLGNFVFECLILFCLGVFPISFFFAIKEFYISNRFVLLIIICG